MVFGLLAAFGVLWAHLAVFLSPARWAIPALAGLAFPVFGVLLIVAMAVMFRRRRWRWFLGFALLILLSGDLYRSVWGGFGWGVPEALTNDAPALKVMGWNVRLYDRYGWLGEDTKKGITEAIADERPDVLCLQEHYRDPDPAAFPVEGPMRRAVGGVEKAPVQVHEVWARGKAGRRFGVATWSRHPIVGRADIAFGTRSNNACAVTDIAWNGDTVRVFNAHFASLHFGSEEYAALEEGVPDAEGRQRIWSRMREAYSERVTQVTWVMEAVARSPHPVVLCGDFNDVPVSWALQAARGQLRDTHDLRGLRMDGTWQGAVPGVRIDHILVDPVWPVLDYGNGGDGLSDHRYVTAVVQAPTP